MAKRGLAPSSLHETDRDLLKEYEHKNEILAEIAGEEYTAPEPLPQGGYLIQKRMLDAAQKENELLEEIAEAGPGGGSSTAKALGIDYATDVITLKNKDGETLQGSGATLPAYGVTFDPATGGLTLTKNGTAVQGQTVTIPNYGSPVGVDASADMTDHDQIYLYLGTTGGGLTKGHFYYWDGSAWADGGEYAAATVQTDKTLLVEDRAADAKATGEAVGELKTQLNDTENGLEQITDVTPINFIDGKYLYTGAQIGSTLDITDIRNFNGLSYAIKDVTAGDVICITGKGLNNAFLYTIIDSNNVILAKASLNEQLNDGIVVAPENADKIILNSETPLLGFCYIGLSLNRRFSYVDLMGKSGKTYKIIAGVIRNSGSGWQFIVDANHQGDLNCISVAANEDGQIVLDYSGISATKVISVVVTPDETFAGLGYLCGGSVGRDKTYIEVYKYAPIGVHGAIDCASDGTITIRTGSEGIISAVWNSEYNTMTVTHDSVDPSDSVPVVIPWKYSKTLPRIASWSGSTVTLDFMQLTDGNKATSVTNELSFMIQRQSAMKLKLVKQDANNIINSNGNFWFIGIFQTS